MPFRVGVALIENFAESGLLIQITKPSLKYDIVGKICLRLRAVEP